MIQLIKHVQSARLVLPTLHFVLSAMHAAVFERILKRTTAAAVVSVLFQDNASVDQDEPLL